MLIVHRDRRFELYRLGPDGGYQPVEDGTSRTDDGARAHIGVGILHCGRAAAVAIWAIVADLPEVRRAQLPDRRPLYDHAATFGVAGDAERMRNGIAPPPIRRAPSRSPRWARPASPNLRNDHGRADVRRWWSSLENGPVDVWHRLRCRRGHHDFRGGHAMQLGSELIFVERRCTWCEARPS